MPTCPDWYDMPGPIWCTTCGRHLRYAFILDAWCCPSHCARLGVRNEALWRLISLLTPPDIPP